MMMILELPLKVKLTKVGIRADNILLIVKVANLIYS
jgi:hypothetical protein